jgi:hypothetical protein
VPFSPGMSNLSDLDIVAEFRTKEAAEKWFYESVEEADLDYVDSDRFAYLDDPAEMADFERAVTCCGNFETVVMIDGRKAIFGVNYGH